MLDNWTFKRAGLSSLSREALDNYQLDMLNKTIKYAMQNSRFYKDRLAYYLNENTAPLTSFEDFARLPFTYPEDIKEKGTAFVCTNANEIERVFSVLETSGSTGKAKKIYFSKEEQEMTIDYFHHGMMEFASPKDIACILFPGSSEGSMNLLLSEALRRMNVTPILLGFPRADKYQEYLYKIMECKANYVIGPPFTIQGLANKSKELNLAKTLSCQINGVLVAGSFVSDEAVCDIKSAWNCFVDEEYGMTETGLAGAVGCRTAGGYHPWESDLFYEIIDPDTGLLVPDGTYGELVVTTLTRRCMPLIRYRTGDITRFIPGMCSCGSVLKHLERVADRHCEKKYNRPTI